MVNVFARQGYCRFKRDRARVCLLSRSRLLGQGKKLKTREYFILHLHLVVKFKTSNEFQSSAYCNEYNIVYVGI